MKKSLIFLSMFILVSLVTGCGNISSSSANDVQNVTNAVSPRSNSTSSANVIVKPISPTSGDHHFDHVISVWRDGSWSDSNTGLHGDKYVITLLGTGSNGDISNPKQPLIEVYNVNGAPHVPETVKYPCPRDIGRLTITSITNTGTVVHFTSSKKSPRVVKFEHKEMELYFFVNKKVAEVREVYISSLHIKDSSLSKELNCI